MDWLVMRRQVPVMSLRVRTSCVHLHDSASAQLLVGRAYIYPFPTHWHSPAFLSTYHNFVYFKIVYHPRVPSECIRIPSGASGCARPAHGFQTLHNLNYFGFSLASAL